MIEDGNSLHGARKSHAVVTRKGRHRRGRGYRGRQGVHLSARGEWVHASGRGRVASFTVVYRPVTTAFAADVPYGVALIQLAEGPQLMSNVVKCGPERMTIGMAVAVTFEDWFEDVSIPKFRPVAG